MVLIKCRRLNRVTTGRRVGPERRRSVTTEGVIVAAFCRFLLSKQCDFQCTFVPV